MMKYVYNGDYHCGETSVQGGEEQMSGKIKYDREKFRKSLNKMFEEMGIPLPDKIQPIEVIVHDDDGSVLKHYWLGEDLKKEKDDG